MSGQSEWDSVYFHIATLEPAREPLPLIEVIIEVFHTRLGDEVSLAEAKAQNRLKKYAQYLRTRIGVDEARGVSSFVRLDVAGAKIDWRHILLSASDDRADRMKKIRLLRRPSIVRQIRDLSADQFENIFKIFSKYCKVEEFITTRRTGDFGIDSLAVVDNFSSFGLFSPKSIRHKLVVQSKKYQSSVAREKIQALNDTVDLIRARSQNVMKHVPPWFWSTDGTISGWLIADKGFQSGAIQYAKDNGILLSDIFDIANIICLGKKFDPYSSHDIKRLLE